MHLLLSVFVDIILPLIILIISIGLSVLLYFVVKKKFNKPHIIIPQNNAKPLVNLKESFCSEKEMKFLEAIHKSLPRECIAFPNVGVAQLIEPKGNLVDYKFVLDKFVDICVFLRKGMKPILVIDLYEPSPVSQQFKKFDENILAILKEVKIPVLHKQLESSYNTNELKIQLLSSMNSTIVAYLKDNILELSDKK